MFTNLSETTIWISQKLRRVNSIKLLFMPFFSVRVFLFGKKAKNRCICYKVCWLPLNQFLSSIWVVLLNRLNVAKLIPIRMISLMILQKVKRTARC